MANFLPGGHGVSSSAVEDTQQVLLAGVARGRSCRATAIPSRATPRPALLPEQPPMRPTIALLVGITALTATAAYAQAPTGQIQGTVRGETGVPLEGVSVVAVGTHFGAVTRPDGRYVITRVAPGTYQLRATRIGYTSREQSITVVAGEEASADFTLPSAAIALDQVVVVGYGTELRKDLTGSVGSVSSEDVANISVARIDQAIPGLVSGVQVQTTNAQPGAVMRLRVRGSGSLQASNDPLIVVDGVIGADLN